MKQWELDALLASVAAFFVWRAWLVFGFGASAMRVRPVRGTACRHISESLEVHLHGLFRGSPRKRFDPLNPMNPMSPRSMAAEEAEMFCVRPRAWSSETWAQGRGSVLKHGGGHAIPGLATPQDRAERCGW